MSKKVPAILYDELVRLPTALFHIVLISTDYHVVNVRSERLGV
jgi:hypothetical protein